MKPRKGEIFRDIKGYEGLYQVSNLGRVRKLVPVRVRERYKPIRERAKAKRLAEGKKPRKTDQRKNKKWHYHTIYQWRLINPWINKSGVVVALWKDGKRSMRCVRYLVADAFMPSKNNPRKVKLLFRNGDETDCRLSNLRWTWMGKRDKIDEVMAYIIWDTAKSNPPRGWMSQLAREFGVSPKAILDWKRRMPEDW